MCVYLYECVILMGKMCPSDLFPSQIELLTKLSKLLDFSDDVRIKIVQGKSLNIFAFLQQSKWGDACIHITCFRGRKDIIRSFP